MTAEQKPNINVGSLDIPASRIAGDLLVIASRSYPIDCFGQGVVIARFCQANGFSPTALQEALTSDTDALQRLANQTNTMHKHGVGSSQVIPPINPKQVVDVVDKSFPTAARFLKEGRDLDTIYPTPNLGQQTLSIE